MQVQIKSFVGAWEGRRMDYQTFITAMHDRMKAQMKSGGKVEVYRTVKNNGMVRTGLIFTQTGVNISPTIYLEEFYEQYLQGVSIDILTQKLREIYEEVQMKQSISYQNILDYSQIQDRIVYKLIQKQANEQLLEDLPYEQFLDLAMVYYVLLDKTEFGTATLLIRNEHVKGWNIRKEDVIQAAGRNTPQLLPIELEKVTEYMYIATNRTHSLGAGVMLYDEWKKTVAEIRENFFVIPSSIHELILIPESFGMDRQQLGAMVKEINATEVAREEVLSDTVYYYDRGTGSISM